MLGVKTGKIRKHLACLSPKGTNLRKNYSVKTTIHPFMRFMCWTISWLLQWLPAKLLYNLNLTFS